MSLLEPTSRGKVVQETAPNSWVHYQEQNLHSSGMLVFKLALRAKWLRETVSDSDPNNLQKQTPLPELPLSRTRAGLLHLYVLQKQSLFSSETKESYVWFLQSLNNFWEVLPEIAGSGNRAFISLLVWKCQENNQDFRHLSEESSHLYLLILHIPNDLHAELELRVKLLYRGHNSRVALSDPFCRFCCKRCI